MLKFKHFTKIQLDFNKIRDFLKQKLELNNIYLQSKLLKASASDNIVDYLNKMI